MDVPSDTPRLVSRLRMSLELTLTLRPSPPPRLGFVSCGVSDCGGVSMSPGRDWADPGLNLVALESLVRRTEKLFLGASLGPCTAKAGGG